MFAVFFKPFGGLLDLAAPVYQHKFSIDEDDGRGKVHQGFIDVFFLKMSKDKQRWALVNPTLVLDYENDTEFLLVDVEMGTMLDKVIGTKGHGVYPRPGIQIGADRPVDGSVEFGYKIIYGEMRGVHRRLHGWAAVRIHREGLHTQSLERRVRRQSSPKSHIDNSRILL